MKIVLSLFGIMIAATMSVAISNSSAQAAGGLEINMVSCACNERQCCCASPPRGISSDPNMECH